VISFVKELSFLPLSFLRLPPSFHLLPPSFHLLLLSSYLSSFWLPPLLSSLQLLSFQQLLLQPV